MPLSLLALLVIPQLAPPTWSADVAPIVFARCTECHRPDGGAPFSLLTFADAKRKAHTIATVVEHGQMPPWPAAQGGELFRYARKLSPDEISTIKRWVEGGTPEGDRARAPTAPTTSGTWSLGTPDLELSTGAPFHVPASGRDIYHYFTIPMNQDAERWLSAIEVRSDAPAVVHHVLFFLDDNDDRDKRTSIGGWAVGMRGQRLPLELGHRIPPGRKLVLQVHFHPSGKAEDVTVKVGMWFCPKPPERTLLEFQLPPAFGRRAGIDIPAGHPAWTLRDTWTLPADLELVSVWAHAHMVCTSAMAIATLPDGTSRVLVDIPDWKFNWQLRYDYREPVRLPKGTRITSELVYDNSERNVDNPNSPPRRVTWGEQTTDEMGSLIFNATPVHEDDLPVLATAYATHIAKSAKDGARLLEGARKFDRNGDGAIDVSEMPQRWKKQLLALDRDHDGVVTFAELEAGLLQDPDGPE